jgi:hypothetical protein
MNALTLTLIRLAFLAVLWLFVIAAVGVVRTDMFGHALSSRQQRRQQKAQRARAPRPARAGRPARSAPQRLLVTGGSLTGTSIGLTDQQITMPLWYCPMITLRADTPGCFPRTASGSLKTSDRPTARTWTGRR